MNYESGFGRLSSITGGAFNQQYNYRTTSDGKKTNQITSISYSGITYPNSDDTRTYTYTYDNNGNITSAKFGIRTVTYEYDSQNQLIKETNEKLGRDFTYTYDNAGNILTETTYVYPTTSTGSGSTSTVSFAYDSGWGDLLSSYGNGTVTRQIAHDEIGNRLSDANRTYTWRNGRELATVTKNGVTWTNTYNANGMRTKRTDGTNTYEYIYNGDKLMQMKKNGEVINFTYIGNTPATMTYQGNTFYYVVNAQGDVTGMTNSAGKLVISYTYDAWGRWIYYIQDTEWSNVLGGINPLLYRGYVYDHETGLYYLQSRYYDYNTHRFLNADAFAATGQGMLGNNMFAYCGNNPVNYIDAYGTYHRSLDSGIRVICFEAPGLKGTALAQLQREAINAPLVIDISISHQLPGTPVYVKGGFLLLIDYEKGEINSYFHGGAGFGYSNGASVSVGVVSDYSNPSNYSGIAYDVNGAYYLGFDHSWNPTVSYDSSPKTSAITFSLGSSCGFGTDYYLPAICIVDEGG